MKFSKHSSLLAAIIILNIIISLVFCFQIYIVLERVLRLERALDEYDFLGYSLAQGEGFKSLHGEESVVRGPGYPVFLAAIYSVFGHSYMVVQVIQCLLSGLIVFLTYHLGKRLHSRNTGLFAAFFMAFNPLLIWYIPRVMVEVIFTAVCLLVFLMTDTFLKKKTVRNAIFLGMLISAAAFIKSFALMFPIAVTVLLLIHKTDLKQIAKYVGVIILTMIVLIAPWTVRNFLVAGKVIPVHSSLGLPLTDGYLYASSFTDNPVKMYKDMWPELLLANWAEEAGYNRITFPAGSLEEELIADKIAVQRFRTMYTTDPLMYVSHVFIRALQLWYLTPKPMLTLFMILFSSLILFMAIGGFLLNKHDKRIWLAITFIGLFWVFHSLIIAAVRFTFPLQPLILTFAGSWLFHKLESALEKKRNKRVIT